MIRVKSRPKENYKEFKHFYSSWQFGNKSFYYYEKDGKDFMYIYHLKTFVIPDSSDLTVSEILKDTEIDYSNWTITKLNNEIPYTKNQLKLDRSSVNSYYSINSYNKKVVDEEAKKELDGTWELRNTGDNSLIEFSIYTELSEYFNTLYLGFPEKKEVPYDRNRVIRKGSFIFEFLKTKLCLD